MCSLRIRCGAVRLKYGNPATLGEMAPRHFLSILGGDGKLFTKGSGRLELAQALIDLLSEDERSNVTPERRRKLEAMAAGAGIHEYSWGNFPDDRLPVGTDVIKACPAAPRVRACD